uniref:Uncharacterized protein n=1 Tax=Rhizophora mucronata TaxID=61149 RepID=A0A2P2P5J8_RHIMU
MDVTIFTSIGCKQTRGKQNT